MLRFLWIYLEFWDGYWAILVFLHLSLWVWAFEVVMDLFVPILICNSVIFVLFYPFLWLWGCYGLFIGILIWVLSNFAPFIRLCIGAMLLQCVLDVMHAVDFWCYSILDRFSRIHIDLEKPDPAREHDANSTREHDANSARSYWERHESDLNRTDLDPKSTQIDCLVYKYVIFYF